ncbi:response regulator transcription factor [Lederbergia citri]|uniref:Response regulator n=1 Tax=Lederbergia citri TaxID=2833580 RepID=A0A942TDL9_9BACI|nr:helix-turn-helix domain-containing protein [Lederbergia citri]MBS4195915.1 response regulator [Lederbergia citri]
MYNVVLVDDDVMVTEFLHAAIPWNDYNFQVVDSFQDGTEALEFLEENTVDLLITDIGMPFMNGIDLLENVSKRKIDSINVIISCHDEFHLAQKALKLGTYDYILKESMEEDMIIKLIKRIKTKLDNEKTTKHQQIKAKQLLQENNMALKSKFMEELLLDNLGPTAEWWEKQEELLDMNFSGERYTAVLCFIDQYHKAIKKYEKETLLYFSIQNILEEIILPMPFHVEEFYLKGKFFLLFSSKKLGQTETENLIEKILFEFYNKLETYLKITLTTLIGEGNQLHEGLVKSIQTLYNHMEQRFYYEHHSFQKFELVSYTEQSIFHGYNETQDYLRQLILKKDQEEAKKYIGEKIKKIKQHQYHPSVVKDWATKLVLDLRLSFKSLGRLEHQEDVSSTNKLIQPVETFKELEMVMNEIVLKMIEYADIIESSPKNEEVFKAQRFVHEHINKKISLTEVANHLHLNASYFSRVFKKETGENFIEFVTRIKMEKAKEMLNNTTKPVEQIAYDLGFDNKSYFFRTFKKQFGVTPCDYKYSGSVLIN